MIAQFFAGRGARLLDENKPGWAGCINRDSLDIGTMYSCVLGQLYGNFTRGLVWLGLGWFQSASYGFLPTWTGKRLNKAWRVEIDKRQPARAPSRSGRSHVLAP